MRDRPIFTTDKLGYAEVLALKGLADWQDAALSVHLKKKNERIKELEEALADALPYVEYGAKFRMSLPDGKETAAERLGRLKHILDSAKSAQAGV